MCNGAKICMSQRMIMKSLISLEKKRFHHENIVCQNQGLLSRGYVTFELKIIKFLLKHKQSYNISMSRDYFGKSVEALRHYFEKSL